MFQTRGDKAEIHAIVIMDGVACRRKLAVIKKNKNEYTFGIRRTFKSQKVINRKKKGCENANTFRVYLREVKK